MTPGCEPGLHGLFGLIGAALDVPRAAHPADDMDADLLLRARVSMVRGICAALHDATVDNTLIQAESYCLCHMLQAAPVTYEAAALAVTR